MRTTLRGGALVADDRAATSAAGGVWGWSNSAAPCTNSESAMAWGVRMLRGLRRQR
jgi:hypothetical protein